MESHLTLILRLLPDIRCRLDLLLGSSRHWIRGGVQSGEPLLIVLHLGVECAKRLVSSLILVEVVLRHHASTVGILSALVGYG